MAPCAIKPSTKPADSSRTRNRSSSPRQQVRALSPRVHTRVAEHPDLRTAANLREALVMVRDHATADDVVFYHRVLFFVAEAREMLVL
jgi:hypothetical protein